MFKTIWALLALSVSVLLPASSNAQMRGQEFELNGKRFVTSNYMTGSRGCNSELVDMRTGRLVCPLDTVADPRTVWRSIIFQMCRIDQYGNAPCYGGFVAVGRNCPQNPARCTYYRIARDHDRNERWDVSNGRISDLGDELWIAKPHGAHWNLFSRCHAGQYVRQNNGQIC